jgi:eukaryotic-like serine/threonine-protein kinase
MAGYMGRALEDLGKYQLVKRLAVGGMAELYLANSSGPKGFKRRVVLKKILPQFADNPAFVEMFLTEARIAGQLSHPNLAQVYEVSEADGTYFITMEYVDGPNLRTLRNKARQAKKPISPFLVARIVAYACDGLGYAHEFKDPETDQPLRIIHRDISPDNIVISSNGAVKVLDFGIAKAATQFHTTRTGTVKGKIAYMAPEQLTRKPMDHRADIYSLGVVLYELLAGERPYEGSNELQLLQARVSKQPIIPIATRRPDLPESLCDIVTKAIEQDPEQRYHTCRELQRALEQVIHQSTMPIGTQEIAKLVAELQAEPEWGKLPAAGAPATPATPPPPEPPRKARAYEGTAEYQAPPRPQEHASEPPPSPPRSRRSAVPIIAGAAAVMVLGLGVAAFYGLRGGPPAPPPPAPKVEAPPAAAASAPVEPPKPALAHLTVESVPPANIRIGKQVQRSPFVGDLEPGDTKIEVFDEDKGFTKVDWIKLAPGETRSAKVRVGKVEVIFRSAAEAKVFVDGRQMRGENGDLTPIKTELWEGRYQVRFQCPGGVVDQQVKTLVPPKVMVTGCGAR